jgi:tRNA (mo5U34)-methyltransferase
MYSIQWETRMPTVDTVADELRRTVASRPTWWHRIDLGHGVVTPGLDDSPSKLQSLGLPADLSGKSVLDIGAWDGFFSFEAERRGADVLATDYYCWTGAGIQDKGGFDIAKRVLQSKVREKTVRVEDIPAANLGCFDVVLFLGVLYHSPDPLGYLRILRSVTKGVAIIETHVDLLDVNRPALAYYPGSTLNGDATNFFGPNEGAVHGMCQDVGFSQIRTAQSWASTRMVFHAYA